MPDIRDIVNETYLRTERTKPSGSRTALRSLQYFAEILGLDDEIRVDNRSIPVTRGLVSWWSLDTVSISGSQANDWWGSSGSNYNHGTITGLLPVAAGKLREALEWRGAVTGPNDMLTVADHSSLQNLWDAGASFECWYYARSDNPGDVAYLADKTEWSVWLSGAGASFVRFRKDFGTTNGIWRVDSPSMSYNAWHHLMITYNASDVANDPIIYLDGVLATLVETQTPVGASVSDVGVALTLGNVVGGGGGTFDGYLDEIRVYNAILTSEEASHNASRVTRAFLGTFYPGTEVAI